MRIIYMCKILYIVNGCSHGHLFHHDHVFASKHSIPCIPSFSYSSSFGKNYFHINFLNVYYNDWWILKILKQRLMANIKIQFYENFLWNSNELLRITFKQEAFRLKTILNSPPETGIKIFLLKFSPLWYTFNSVYKKIPLFNYLYTMTSIWYISGPILLYIIKAS